MTAPHRVPETLFRVRTDRLLLTAAATDDADALFELMTDPSGWWYAPDQRHHTIDDTRAWWRRSVDDWRSCRLSYWCARDPVSENIIGVGGPQWRREGYWNLSWRIRTKDQGRGLAQELGQAAVNAALLVDPTLPIIAWVDSINVPSLAVACAIGLTNYGRHIDPGDGSHRLALADRPPRGVTGVVADRAG